MIPRYRAWKTIGTNEMFHNVVAISWNNNKIAVLYPNPGRNTFRIDEESLENVILMQSTGLKDKNGVEIFEGDVVAVENHPFQRKEDSGAGIEIEGNYVVGWSQHDLTWCAGDLLLARLKSYVRVIGNIYENSELLEVE